jgi:urea ABC transporter urea binding protein
MSTMIRELSGELSGELSADKSMVRVGIIHSLTGTMAIGETSLIDAELMAIAEINAASGVLGKTIQPIIEDGASDLYTYARKVKKLIVEDQIVTAFGGWSSSSRKAMMPIFEKYNSLLWYPLQYEALECSPNIFYSGCCPNQQIMPAVAWIMQHQGNRLYLLGSDYVFPRSYNKIITAELQHRGGTVVGVEYVPMGTTEFGATIESIKQAKPDAVFSTLNGDCNLAFYEQYAQAGIKAEDIPIVAFSAAEEVFSKIGEPAAGHYACWSYFQSIDTPENKSFVQRFQAAYGSDRVTSDPIEAAYTQVYLWKQAVEAAQSFEVEKVLAAAHHQTFAAPGGLVKVEKHHLWKHSHIGKLQPNGQFQIVATHIKPNQTLPGESEAPEHNLDQLIKPQPWLGIDELDSEVVPVVIAMLSEAPQAIHREWELETKSQELKAALAQLQAVNTQLERTQHELVQSEKMAALGQLVAGVAHEINNPLGAISSSVDNIGGFFSKTLGELPNFLQTLSPLEQQAFSNLIQQFANQNDNLSSKEKRQLRKTLAKEIEELAIDDGEAIADILVDIGVRHQLHLFLPIFQSPNCPQILSMAYQLSTLKTSSDAIKMASNRANKIVFALKSYARYNQSGNKSLTNILENVESVLTLYQSQLKQGIQIVRYYPTEIPLILCYPDELNQVWTNLIYNALQAMNNKGVLTLTIQLQKKHICIEITDTGLGIPPEILPRIFEPFFTTKPMGEGSGLGLNIVKKIIDKHDGTISVRSVPKATTFSVYLPLVLSPEAAMQSEHA